jgi:AbrB family looped-hinge helix DNA binding protein
MFTITMGPKGRFILPKALREQLKLLPGSKVEVTVDNRRRVILTPALHKPEDLYRDRPKVTRLASVEQMDRGIAKALVNGI